MTFTKLTELICYLKNLEAGEAHDAFYQSIIDDLTLHGFSSERAIQVIDDLVDKINCK
jgi:hypothetical protein